jgi:hypothetical protein
MRTNPQHNKRVMRNSVRTCLVEVLITTHLPRRPESASMAAPSSSSSSAGRSITCNVIVIIGIGNNANHPSPPSDTLGLTHSRANNQHGNARQCVVDGATTHSASCYDAGHAISQQQPNNNNNYHIHPQDMHSPINTHLDNVAD